MDKALQAFEGEIMEATLKAQNAIVKPAVTPAEALEAWSQYEQLKKQIITKDDLQTIKGKDFLKKSYWKKCATFFNLSVQKLSEERLVEMDGSITFESTYRATAPNGRFSDGDGACNTLEKSKDGSHNSIHNTRSTAHTRAANRAISNLVGGGEVSAEEADQELSAWNAGAQTSQNTQASEKKASPASSSKRTKKGGNPISEAQGRRLFAIAKAKGYGQNELADLLLEWNYTDLSEIGWKDYKEICDELEKPKKEWRDPSEPPPPTDDDISFKSTKGNQ